jgi:hypothetical protein
MQDRLRRQDERLLYVLQMLVENSTQRRKAQNIGFRHNLNLYFKKIKNFVLFVLSLRLYTSAPLRLISKFIFWKQKVASHRAGEADPAYAVTFSSYLISAKV